jgi:hypothetical protein
VHLIANRPRNWTCQVKLSRHFELANESKKVASLHQRFLKNEKQLTCSTMRNFPRSQNCFLHSQICEFSSFQVRHLNSAIILHMDSLPMMQLAGLCLGIRDAEILATTIVGCTLLTEIHLDGWGKQSEN